MNIYALWAYEIKGIGRKTLFALRNTYGEEIYEKLYSASAPEICDLAEGAGIRRSRALSSLFVRGRENTPGERKMELERGELFFTCFDDPEYPERLKSIPDPPFGLFYRGKLPDNTAPTLAVIGSRESTPYGRQLSRRFATALASEGIQIISGMARGIDSIAQAAALDAGGYSCAVLGSGADVCYPESSRDLYNTLRMRGGIVSEYLPGTLPKAALFPPRNRIVSGLSDAVLVMEAGERSGTMITAEAALEQGKDVFAVPGRPDDVKSRGCNALIREGASLVESPESLLGYFFTGEPQTDAAWCLADLKRERARIEEEKKRAAEMEKTQAWVQAGLPLERTEEEKKADGGNFWSIVLTSLTGEGAPLKEVLVKVREKAGRSVSVTELERELKRLTAKGLVQEKAGRYAAVKHDS